MHTLKTAEGLPLHVRQWAIAGAARGTVLIVHGLGEHIGRYQSLADHLNACGWTVVGYDQRGHGASGGPRGGIPQAHSLLQDLALVIDKLRTVYPGPLLLLGHSMGAAVVARFVAEGLSNAPAEWYRVVDGLVLSSPALDVGMNALQKLLLAVALPLVPGLALGNGLKPAWISRDAAVVAAYQADPLVHDRITPRLARFMVDAGALARAVAPQWSLPTLLLYAGADRCVAPQGSADFAGAAPASVVQARRFDALAHEIFNEPERAQVLQVLATWLAQRGH